MKYLLRRFKHNEKICISILMYFIIVAFTGACVSLCFNHNIWTDEAFTMQLLESDFIGIIEGTAADVHPPLYYLIAKVFQIIFGHSLLIQKLFAIIPTTLLMIFGVTKIRNMFGNKTAITFLLMLVAFPPVFEYSVQPRMYTLGMLFVTMCGIYAMEVYENTTNKSWIRMTASGLAAAYTHYFALLAVAFIYMLLLLLFMCRKRSLIKVWLVMGAVTVLLYLPWFFVWLKQLANVVESYHIPQIDKETIWSYVEWAFGSDAPYTVFLYMGLYLCMIFILLIKLKKKKEIKNIFALYYFFVPILVVATGVILSILIRPIFQDRYMYPAMGMMIVMFAIAMIDVEKRVIVGLVVFALVLGIVQYRYNYYVEYHSSKVAETEDFFQENLGENDMIMYNFHRSGFIYERYWPAKQLVYVKDIDYSKQYDTIWYMETYNRTYISKKEFQRHGLKKEYVGEYGIEQNEFTIYKMVESKITQRNHNE